MTGTRPGAMTPSAGRRFGWTVGTAFLVLAAVAVWRGYPTVSLVLGSLGAALAVAGLLIPTYLGPVERGWMALAHAISKITTPIVMGIMYLAVIYPVGLLRRNLGSNPMLHPQVEESFFHSRAPGERRSKSMQRQF